MYIDKEKNSKDEYIEKEKEMKETYTRKEKDIYTCCWRGGLPSFGCYPRTASNPSLSSQQPPTTVGHGRPLTR
jgi:hypothetical protein